MKEHSPWMIFKNKQTQIAFLSCDTTVIKLLLYGGDSLDSLTNTLILNDSAGFILSSILSTL